MEYRKEIDGLRALAVLPVILFHAGFTAFSGGFVGVDIFFVISGYLITTIIVTEMEQGSFSLLNFYERRARRILPALFFVMLCTLPFAWLWMLPHDLKIFSESLIAVPLFSSNVLFYLTSDYFDTASELKPLLHTWSLAVEEQYYVLFPLFLIFFWKLGKKWIIHLLLAFSVASIVAAQTVSSTHPSLAFYMLPTRGFEILVGTLISLFVNYKSGAISVSHSVGQSVSIAGLMLIFYAIFQFDKNTPSPGLYTLIPTIGAGLILVFSSNKNLVGKLLGSKIFSGIGLISYSAYLWHQPLLAFARLRSIDKPTDIILALLCLSSLALAYLTLNYVENPFRKKSNVSIKTILASTIIASSLFITIGMIGYKNIGFPQRLNFGTLDFSKESEFKNIPKIDNGWCFYSIDSINNLNYGEDGLKCHIGSTPDGKYNGILFGDSFAGSYEPFWDYIGKRNNLKIHSITTNWCYPAFNNSFTGPQSSKAYAQCLYNRKYLKENYKKYDFVILSGMWSDILRKQQLNGVTELIDTISKNVKLVIIMPSPNQYDYSPISYFEKQLLFRTQFDIKKISSKREILALKANDILLSASKNYPNVIYLARETIFDGNELSDKGIPYSADGAHISIYGSKEIVKHFARKDEYTRLIDRIKK
jgi:peptidoglycan/LPS O-acetylase OafA/YrhL